MASNPSPQRPDTDPLGHPLRRHEPDCTGAFGRPGWARGLAHEGECSARLEWLPPVLRLHATWATVWRFVWLGPLVGGLPYVWTLVGVPFAYLIGAAPAAVAGLLFGAWFHRPGGRVPSRARRAAAGALAGAGSALLMTLVMMLFMPEGWFLGLVMAVHGVPAATVLALLQRPVQPAGAAR